MVGASGCPENRETTQQNHGKTSVKPMSGLENTSDLGDKPRFGLENTQDLSDLEMIHFAAFPVFD